jgi:hypothetical protein
MVVVVCNFYSLPMQRLLVRQTIAWVVAIVVIFLLVFLFVLSC